MANIVMASSFKTLASSPSPNLPQNPNFKQPPTVSIPTAPSHSNSGKLQSFLLRLWNPSSRNSITAATVSAATALLYASPSLAAEIEKAALFDFNLTLPAIALEFVILMVALDKIYYTPLGNFMDERDAAIRESLSSVKDTSEEVKQLEDQASAVLKAARAEISAALNKMKKETSAELEEKLKEGRKKVEAELAEALQKLERQKEDTIKALDSQIADLSEDIVKKVLPL
ncbi:ATP synthase subunit b', chloroplastic-like [Aristolochia californica]|uniref:ATP synthase subunit b', chloroplastic-like n=1 Tax=Aristolochia californica TaxID=171875 RepID=UPI0035D9EB0C